MPGDQGNRMRNVLNGRLRIEENNNRLLVSDNNGLDILLLGEDNAGNIVVKLAQAGFDVKTATDGQLIFNSGQNAFKIVDKGHITTPVLSTSAAAGTSKYAEVTQTYDHNLGFSPGFLAWIYGNSAVTMLPYFSATPQASTTSMYLANTWVTMTDTQLIAHDSVTIQNFTAGTLNYSGGQNTVYFYILQETAIPA